MRIKNSIITIPTLHPGQDKAMKSRSRFKAIRCGRRWGKTYLLEALASDRSIKNKSVGIFAPDYKILSETYKEIEDILSPLITSSSEMKGVIRLPGKGRIDFWTLNNPRAGRSRKYHLVLLDEVAFAGADMMDIWEKSIKPSLLDYRGGAWAFSTPNGEDEENFFYRICTDKTLGFAEFHAPTHTNPYLPAEELAKLEKENAPQVYRQEYLGEFVNWNGAAFFSIDALTEKSFPVIPPERTDQIFAVMDTALKDGSENDGTAIIYFSRNKCIGAPLIILDWDILQIEGAFLENYVPSVHARIEEYAQTYRAREGNAGVWIEDKASGIMLLQQMRNRGISAFPIDSKLTALGKDGRALSVSGYVHQGKVKISEYAFNKVVNYKGSSKNHLLSQVCGYRLGSKDAAKRADDLFDAFTYGISIALGDPQGW